ncbi:MAG: WD40 repeat domain-containing protein [Chloroflexi bacterium]|nr:WD40 repeat domain-containing protein [Chloroflexota bacterium]
MAFEEIWEVVFSPSNANLLAIVAGGQVHLYDLENDREVPGPRLGTGLLLAFLQPEGDRLDKGWDAMRISPDSGMVAALSRGHIELWDTASFDHRLLSRIFSLFGDESFGFSPDGGVFADLRTNFAPTRKARRFWDTQTGAELPIQINWGEGSRVSAPPKFSADGSRLAISANTFVIALDLGYVLPRAQREELQILEAERVAGLPESAERKRQESVKAADKSERLRIITEAKRQCRLGGQCIVCGVKVESSFWDLCQHHRGS